jgi:hypothetical protein
MIQNITHNGQLLALIISRHFNQPGIHFFTPDDFSQQLAYMRHPAGKIIEAHVHNPVLREVHFTKEVLFLRIGNTKPLFRVKSFFSCKN